MTNLVVLLVAEMMANMVKAKLPRLSEEQLRLVEVLRSSVTTSGMVFLILGQVP